MISFIISVLASLFAAGIIAIFARLFNKKLGSFAKRWLIHVFDIGTYDMFFNEADEEYKKDLEKELKKAEYIHIFAGRGQFLTKEPFRSLLDKITIPVHILLPNLIEEHDIDWIETALGQLSPHKSFRTQISANVGYIISLISKRKDSNIKLSYYHALAVGKITITNRVAYFQPYTEDFSDKSPIYKYKKDSFMYKWSVRYFNSYWNPQHIKADKPSEDCSQGTATDNN